VRAAAEAEAGEQIKEAAKHGNTSDGELLS
jgi:hypothetical protein